MTDTTNDRLTLQHRACRPDDFEAVAALHGRAFAALAKSHYSAAQIAAHQALVDDPAYAAELARTHLRLAFDRPGVLAATAGWRREPGAGTAPGSPRTARIGLVYVDPRFARRGIARWMVADIERRAWKQGCRAFLVRAPLNAVPFFASLGYAPAGEDTVATPTGIGLAAVILVRATPPVALAAEPQTLD